MQANTYSSPSFAGGNKEYQTGVLTTLEPEATPLVSMMRKGPSVKGTLIETLADTLRKPRTTGTREGQDAGKGGNKAKDRRRFGTRLQRVMDSYGVTDVQQLISENGGVAGVADEYARSKAKTISEVKRDIEAVIGSENEHYDGTEADMKTRGAFTWLEAVGVSTLQTVAPLVPPEYRPKATSATGTTTVSAVKTGTVATGFAEDDLNLMLQALQREHGPGKTFEAVLGDNLINKVDHFTRTNTSSTATRYTVQENASTHHITMMVKVFESSQGRANFIPSQFLKVDVNGNGDPNAGLLLWMPHWHLDFLEDLHAVDSPETAGGQDGYAKAIFALLCDMPRGSGKIDG